MAEPVVHSWNSLVKRKDSYGGKSYTRETHGFACKHANYDCSCTKLGVNPNCIVASSFCSKAIKEGSDLCFWHFHRAAALEPGRCECKGQQTLVGDAVAQALYIKIQVARNILSVEQAQEQIDNIALFDTDTGEYFCPRHDCTYDPEEEEEEDEDWEHMQRFLKELASEVAKRSFRSVAWIRIGEDGPVFDASHGSGLDDIDNAAGALQAAGLDLKHADWWLWMSRWYPDCPKSLGRFY